MRTIGAPLATVAAVAEALWASRRRRAVQSARVAAVPAPTAPRCSRLALSRPWIGRHCRPPPLPLCRAPARRRRLVPLARVRLSVPLLPHAARSVTRSRRRSPRLPPRPRPRRAQTLHMQRHPPRIRMCECLMWPPRPLHQSMKASPQRALCMLPLALPRLALYLLASVPTRPWPVRVWRPRRREAAADFHSSFVHTINSFVSRVGTAPAHAWLLRSTDQRAP